MERRPNIGVRPLASLGAWRRSSTVLAVLSLIFLTTLHAGPQPRLDPRQQARLDEALRREGDALVELADRAMNGRGAPSDFPMTWHNDFLKAQPGTFVPFTINIDARIRQTAGALMYVRVVPRAAAGKRRSGAVAPTHEAIFAVDVSGDEAQPVRVRRGFAVPPGSYTVYAVLRERPADLLERRNGSRRAGVLIQSLDVPDFWTGQLTTSTVMLAERVEPLAAGLAQASLEENPYVVGNSRVYPASSAAFRREDELVVVFLIYNQTVDADKHFDVQVDYHLYRKTREGERYVTRTNPQRFNPSMMGTHYDPASGQPVLAGQGILLSEFEHGDYRLGITVTDLHCRSS
jgi:hypothetical protein